MHKSAKVVILFSKVVFWASPIEFFKGDLFSFCKNLQALHVRGHAVAFIGFEFVSFVVSITSVAEPDCILRTRCWPVVFGFSGCTTGLLDV